ncbi:MAG: formylglycine-generating enzyme family protein [Thermodesulfobacteriota bacterium]
MVLIPKGRFLYGDEQIESEIGYDYKIDVFPVTNRQYKVFIDATNREVPFGDDEGAVPYNWDRENRTYPEGLGDHPVVLVTYEDVADFCTWRSEKEGAEIHLPTEEEWEKAARGIDGRQYPWGDDFDFKKLNCADNHVGKVVKDWVKEFRKGFLEKNKGKALTSEVGRFTEGSGPFGCHDMAGNVWEWTDSWYDKDKDNKVLRGGSWFLEGDNCRAAYRGRDYPGLRDGYTGFRCARTLK